MHSDDGGAADARDDLADHRAAAVILATSAVGGLAGVVLPGWFVPWATDERTWLLILVLVLLGVPLAGAVAGARIAGRTAAGVLVALLDVVAAVLVFFMTWFSVGPGSLVGLWLLLAAAVLGFEPGIRRRLAVVGLVVVGATLVAGSGVLLHVPALAVPVALALNAGAVVYLSRLAARRPLPRRRSSV